MLEFNHCNKQVTRKIKMTFQDYITDRAVYPKKVQAVKDGRISVFTIEQRNGVEFRVLLVEAGYTYIQFI